MKQTKNVVFSASEFSGKSTLSDRKEWAHPNAPPFTRIWSYTSRFMVSENYFFLCFSDFFSQSDTMVKWKSDFEGSTTIFSIANYCMSIDYFI